MKYNKFPKTDLKVSAIGLGTWVLGGDHWGGSKELDGTNAVRAAIEQGINFIDTAPIYGFGRAEHIVGKAIKGKRDSVIVATKCGLSWKGKQVWHDLKPETIKKELEASLQRLDVEHIDLYQCHWPDPQTPLESTMETLKKLQEQGKIRYIGVSNFDLTLLKKAVSLADIVTLQRQYSILEREVEKEILPYCHKNQIGFLAYGVLGGGILTGKYHDQPQWQKSDARNFFYKHYTEEGFKKAREVLEDLKKGARPLNQTALNWVRKKHGVTSVLAGCRNVKQVLENIEAMKWI
ncbi:hypothetical protein MNBD_UNCLBAC01-709 [hydrothermal vent metagenome]|uniref:NADP-dependent oxidoreductase domain-containing protein n=1 Tax=hydrothermal vent metagenome TaxID=652676 RepID=A0A3B1DG54_9ZZZZ